MIDKLTGYSNGRHSVEERVLSAAAAAAEAAVAGRETLDEAADKFAPDIRRIAEHLLLNYFRRRRALTAHLAALCRCPPAPPVAYLLELALAQALFHSLVPAASVVNVAVTLAKPYHADKFVNAVLRRALASPPELTDTPEAVLPEPVLRRWQLEFDADTIGHLTAALLAGAEFTYRCCGETPLLPETKPVPGYGPFRFGTGSGRKILAGPELAAGGIYIQDPATSLPVSLAEQEVRRAGSVLDLCAAPGGKTLMLAELLPAGAKLTAADISARRQRLTAANLARCGRTCEVVTAAPEQLRGRYDLVLADLPCSNSGVFRRRPDALWRLTEESMRRIKEVQRQILASAVKLVAPGGTLLAATCSIEQDENGGIAAEILRLRPDWRPAAEKTLLPSRHHDGAWAAKFATAE